MLFNEKKKCFHVQTATFIVLVSGCKFEMCFVSEVRANLVTEVVKLGWSTRYSLPSKIMTMSHPIIALALEISLNYNAKRVHQTIGFMRCKSWVWIYC